MSSVWNWYRYCDLAEVAPDCWSPEEVQDRLVARDWCVSKQSLIDACDNYKDASWFGEEPIKVAMDRPSSPALTSIEESEK